jgi:hypothetical protein
MKRYIFLILFVLLGTFATQCGEEEAPSVAEKSPTPEKTIQRPDVYTVAEVKSATWPSPGDAEILQLDPVPTRANYLAVLDMSGSMKDPDCAGRYGSKADAARAALAAWLRSVPRTANIGLVVFSGGAVSLKVPLGVNNREAFIRAVANTRPSGRTPLRDAVALAHKELERRARYQQGYGDYRIVVITDGMHSEGQDPRPVVDAILGNPANPALIYTIGFCIEESALHQPGRTMYQSAKNPEELSSGLQRVLAESQQFDTIKEFGNHAD